MICAREGCMWNWKTYILPGRNSFIPFIPNFVKKTTKVLKVYKSYIMTKKKLERFAQNYCEMRPNVLKFICMNLYL